MKWVIGDVHGCARELERLLRKIQFDATRDKLWFAGDLVNRGPDSLDVLRIWNDLGRRGVLGNHDAYAVLAMRGERSRPSAEIEAVLKSREGLKLLDRLSELPLLAKLGKLKDGSERRVWLVHAGLHPAWQDPKETAAEIDSPRHTTDWLESGSTQIATRIRYCRPDGKMVRTDSEGNPVESKAKPWDAYYKGEALIIHGHWARRGYYRGKRTIGIDSGCVYGGRLTAWCLEDDRIVSVRFRG